MNLLRAVSPKVPACAPRQSNRHLTVAEARVMGPDGTLYAHGATIFLVLDVPSG